jgi:short-subunit dehydrogenase
MRRAIIIGGTSGIGRAVAERMAAAGWEVRATGRSTGFDITAPDAVERLAELAGGMGGVDMVVYSAGTGDLNPRLDIAIETRTNAVNVDAFTRVMVWAYSYFAARGGGHIAAVTSVAGLRGGGAAPAYGASKAYQVNFLEALRQRATKDKSGVKITDLRPGSVDTAMMKGEGHFWIATPERAAEHVFRALRHGRRVAYITPRWRFMGVIMKIIPRGIWEKM